MVDDFGIALEPCISAHCMWVKKPPQSSSVAPKRKGHFVGASPWNATARDVSCLDSLNSNPSTVHLQEVIEEVESLESLSSLGHRDLWFVEEVFCK